MATPGTCPAAASQKAPEASPGRPENAEDDSDPDASVGGLAKSDEYARQASDCKCSQGRKGGCEAPQDSHCGNAFDPADPVGKGRSGLSRRRP
jgi:hypothetical protein